MVGGMQLESGAQGRDGTGQAPLKGNTYTRQGTTKPLVTSAVVRWTLKINICMIFKSFKTRDSINISLCLTPLTGSTLPILYSDLPLLPGKVRTGHH